MVAGPDVINSRHYLSELKLIQPQVMRLRGKVGAARFFAVRNRAARTLTLPI
jgi:hypothetical protein